SMSVVIPLCLFFSMTHLPPCWPCLLLFLLVLKGPLEQWFPNYVTDVTFSQWFCFLINACSSLRSLLCLLERNTALQGKIRGNMGDFDAQNDVSVSKVQFRFKVFIPQIPSVFRYRGKSLALITSDRISHLTS